MEYAELAAFVMELLENLETDEGTNGVENAIVVVCDTAGNIAYRTTDSDTQENINMLARAIGLESGYFDEED